MVINNSDTSSAKASISYQGIPQTSSYFTNFLDATDSECKEMDMKEARQIGVIGLNPKTYRNPTNIQQDLTQSIQAHQMNGFHPTLAGSSISLSVWQSQPRVQIIISMHQLIFLI